MEELRLPLKRAVFTALYATTIVAGISTAKAELSMDFTAKEAGPAGAGIPGKLLDCRFSSPIAAPSGDCNRGGDYTFDPDHTPFLEETVMDDGKMYYHVLVGDPASDFSLEYFIEIGGGNYLEYSQYPTSASEGGFNGGIGATPSGPGAIYTGLDFVSPLAKTIRDFVPESSGNGSGNPTKVTFRQTILQGTSLNPTTADPGFSQIILKDQYDKKPIITQTLADDEVYSDFEVDMSELGYTDDFLTQNGTIKNVMTVIDKTTGYVYTDFDQTDALAKDTQIHTSNGAYRYHNPLNPGPKIIFGIEVPTTEVLGEYEYDSGTYDIYAVEWAAYWNADENVNDDGM